MTVLQVQMFNMFNARKIRDEYNIFEGICKAHMFLSIWTLIVVFQVYSICMLTSCTHTCLESFFVNILVLVTSTSRGHMGVCACMQLVIMFFLGGIFKVERQSWAEWLVSMAIGTGSIPVSFFTKFITRCVEQSFLQSSAVSSVHQKLTCSISVIGKSL